MNLKKYICESFQFYSTPKLVQVKSPTIAIVSVLLFVTVWLSFLATISYDVTRLYKTCYPVRGAVLTQVEGFASTKNLTDDDINMKSPDLYKRTWDTTDLVHPIHGGEAGTGSFTIVTNMVITPDQYLGKCASAPSSKNTTKELNCTIDSDCKKGHWGPETHGILTGKCVNSFNGKSCEIEGWCPVEPPSEVFPRYGSLPLLEQVQDFTIFLKNSVDFPGGDERTLTNVANETGEYLQGCFYNPDKDPYCPRFRIRDIILAHDTKPNIHYEEVFILGAVYRIRINWMCDLDFWRNYSRDNCDLTYTFDRVDDPDAGVSRGWFFRSAKYSGDKRTLYKNYGIKFIVEVEGHARKFDFFLLITMIGSTIGYFSVTALVCDNLLDIFNYLTKKKHLNRRFHSVRDRFDENGKKEEESPEVEYMRCKS